MTLRIPKSMLRGAGGLNEDEAGHGSPESNGEARNPMT
jgi:hypothetical protein